LQIDKEFELKYFLALMNYTNNKCLRSRVWSYSILATTIFFFWGCEFIPTFQKEKAENLSLPIARVNESYLYLDDLESLVTSNTSKEDSIKITGLYVDGWIKKQLMINKANSVLAFEEAEVERKVLDYKYALIIHQYEKYFIDKQLDKEVSEEEIAAYYEAKKDNFILKQNIVKCLFAKVPLEAPRIDGFRKQMASYPNQEMEKMKSYAFQFATKSYLEDTIWINFDEIIQSTPFAGIPNKVQFLRTNRVVESKDDRFVYFLSILDYKISDQVSPLEFMSDDIRNIIINKRKVAIKEELQERVYKDAVSNKTFEIYEYN
jgi:hypothetical protein